MKLYEINDAIRAAMDKVEAADGELTPELAAELDALDMAWSEKAEHCALFVRECEANADAVETEVKRLSGKARALHSRGDWLKGYIFDCMTARQTDKFKGKLIGARIQQGPPAVNVLDAPLVPQSFYTQPAPVLNRTAILDALKAGTPVPGAELVRRPFLRIV